MSKLTSLEAARVIELVLDYKSPMSKCEPLVAGEEPEVDAIMLEFSRAAKLDIPLLDLPPVMTKRQPNKRLSDVQTIALMKAIKGSKLSNPHGFCFAVKSAATPESLEKFARYLFDYWRRNGAESKNRWQFMALGLFGGDATVNQLMKLIRRWPGEGQHPSAVYGLECVGSIGSDYALIEISRLAQNSKFRGLKGAANTCIENIAGRRGLTRDELEDRIVPHCGLGASEPQIFDFGCRQFKLALGPGLKPMIVQPDGKYRTDLPKPGAADDPTIAREAVAEWKAAKKQITDTVKMQSIRLEQAMILGRRWSYDEFQRFFVHHPLMTNVIYHIVWASFGDEDSKIDTFRVTEDGSLADPRDKPYNPPFHAQIGIPHPIQLSNLDLKAWGEQLSDYEITPLFPQIGRPTYRLEPSEKEAQEVTRFTNQKISASWLIFTLDKLGWTRGLSEDGGWIIAHSKHFQSANVTAFVQYTPGVIVGMIPNSEEQTVSYIFFTPSTSNGSNVQTHFSDRVVLGEIDPVAVSEVLADLSVVFAKAK